jgi:hypothetical protein
VLEPGVQTRSVQVPLPVQEYPFAAVPAHCADEYPRPSALQTRRLLTSVHEKSPGVQTQALQSPALQVVCAPQAVSL